MEKKELTHKGSLKFLRAVKSVLEIFESETRDVGKTSSNVTALFGKKNRKKGHCHGARFIGRKEGRLGGRGHHFSW